MSNLTPTGNARPRCDGDVTRDLVGRDGFVADRDEDAIAAAAHATCVHATPADFAKVLEI